MDPGFHDERSGRARVVERCVTPPYIILWRSRKELLDMTADLHET
jgi:hypothetical protein